MAPSSFNGQDYLASLYRSEQPKRRETYEELIGRRDMSNYTTQGRQKVRDRTRYRGRRSPPPMRTQNPVAAPSALTPLGSRKRRLPDEATASAKKAKTSVDPPVTLENQKNHNEAPVVDSSMHKKHKSSNESAATAKKVNHSADTLFTPFNSQKNFKHAPAAESSTIKKRRFSDDTGGAIKKVKTSADLPATILENHKSLTDSSSSDSSTRQKCRVPGQAAVTATKKDEVLADAVVTPSNGHENFKDTQAVQSLEAKKGRISQNAAGVAKKDKAAAISAAAINRNPKPHNNATTADSALRKKRKTPDSEPTPGPVIFKKSKTSEPASLAPSDPEEGTSNSRRNSNTSSTSTKSSSSGARLPPIHLTSNQHPSNPDLFISLPAHIPKLHKTKQADFTLYQAYMHLKNLYENLSILSTTIPEHLAACNATTSTHPSADDAGLTDGLHQMCKALSGLWERVYANLEEFIWTLQAEPIKDFLAPVYTMLLQLKIWYLDVEKVYEELDTISEQKQELRMEKMKSVATPMAEKVTSRVEEFVMHLRLAKILVKRF